MCFKEKALFQSCRKPFVGTHYARSAVHILGVTRMRSCVRVGKSLFSTVHYTTVSFMSSGMFVRVFISYVTIVFQQNPAHVASALY